MFRFDFEKTLQASGVLLGLEGGRMGRVRLLKLLYISDRELLAETGRTITGDQAVAMKLGPVLIRTYDLTEGEGCLVDDWRRFLGSEGHTVILRDDPGRGELSKREIEKLAEVATRYPGTDAEEGDWILSNITHEFEEWSKNYEEGTSRPIPWRDVLEAQGKADLIDAAERDEAERRALDDLFGSLKSVGR